MAMGRPIAGTPWSIVIEFPDRALLHHAGAFLRRMIVIGLALLLIGLAGAFALSRSITKPLHTLTLAASGITAGDYSRFVDIRTSDELGVLSRAFNAMTARVRDSQRELEQEVSQRTAQLLTVNKELEAFSYSVSHDLRAPLRHVNGFSQALLEDHSDQLDEVGKGYLRELRGASIEMAHLIDDVLQLARISRSEMHREPVDLSELARTVVAELQRADPGHEVILRIADDLSTQGDRRLLQIMLSNLLGNSWKFTSKRDLAEITLGQEQKDGETCYFVRDNGAGFDMAHVDRLFSAFQRLHTVREFEGTGIGLATVQRIVHRHGGKVWASGGVNKGATFYFTLAEFPEVSNGEQGDLAGGG
jgi:light-regulated signal transduction histidine kinase (bacteriophytochrome)